LLPVRQADANAVILALTHLFAAYGSPLVLKTDNGSPFLAGLQKGDASIFLDPPARPH
jgi:hypothetical protein